MKLYATTTSERASKGQGGNEYIDIEIKNRTAITILKIRIEPDEDNAKITSYWSGCINDDIAKGKNLKTAKMPPRATDGEWDNI